MSEIPFLFFPMPKYFLDNNLLNSPNAWAFVCWCFSRCSPNVRTIRHGSLSVTLQPFEFVFGRKICATETGMTEDQVRTQQSFFESQKFVEKSPNKTPNKFTIYRWSTAIFCQDHPQHFPQQNPQQTPNKSPTNPHNQDRRSKIQEEISSSTPTPLALDDVVDLSLKKEVCSGVWLSQAELDDCIKSRGSLSLVEQVIGQVLAWDGRENEIKNWPAVIKKWKLKSPAIARNAENLELAIKLSEMYCTANSWRCELHKDPHKDVKGLLFYNYAPTGSGETILISCSDKDFKTKVLTTLREKRMIKNSQDDTKAQGVKTI